MQALGFYAALPFFYLLSLLPLPLLYLFSDAAFIVIYQLAGYRKNVVYENLKNAFPEKTEAERSEIMVGFYHFLCDFLVETIKMLTMDEVFIRKHCTFDAEAKKLFDHYHESRQSIVVAMGHFGNWEWAGNSFPLYCKQQLYVIYKPLGNPFWNSLIENVRRNFGTRLIEMELTFKEMLRQKEEINATVFIADQTPSPKNAYWLNFMNQDTPVFRGTEMIARKMNLPVVYATVRRVKRGCYTIYAETLFENSRQTDESEISVAHTRKLEADIRNQPETWLWSHRRWKHQRPAQD